MDTVSDQRQDEERTSNLLDKPIYGLRVENIKQGSCYWPKEKETV